MQIMNLIHHILFCKINLKKMCLIANLEKRNLKRREGEEQRRECTDTDKAELSFRFSSENTHLERQSVMNLEFLEVYHLKILVKEGRREVEEGEEGGRRGEEGGTYRYGQR
jgi:hypothetical protein